MNIINGIAKGALRVCEPHQVWPLRSECCGRGAPTKLECAECMKMCCLPKLGSDLADCWHIIHHHLHVFLKTRLWLATSQDKLTIGTVPHVVDDVITGCDVAW